MLDKTLPVELIQSAFHIIFPVDYGYDSTLEYALYVVRYRAVGKQTA